MKTDEVDSILIAACIEVIEGDLTFILVNHIPAEEQ